MTNGFHHWVAQTPRPKHRACVYCATMYDAKNGNQNTCSDNCSRLNSNYLARQAAWDRAHDIVKAGGHAR